MKSSAKESNKSVWECLWRASWLSVDDGTTPLTHNTTELRYTPTFDILKVFHIVVSLIPFLKWWQVSFSYIIFAFNTSTTSIRSFVQTVLLPNECCDPIKCLWQEHVKQTTNSTAFWFTVNIVNLLSSRFMNYAFSKILHACSYVSL